MIKRNEGTIMPVSKEPKCEYFHVHESTVQSVKEHLPDDELLYDLADLFKVFGDITRIRILYALFESPMCVCDIATLLSMEPSAISHQIKVLKRSKLVRSERKGKSVFYSLDDDHVRSMIDGGLEHITE